MSELGWLVLPLEPGTYEAVHVVVAQVVALGGAVGWLQVPDRAATRAWLDGVLQSGGRLVVGRGPEGTVLGLGHWRRFDAPVLRQNAEISKVMTVPAARGCGVARRVVEALVRDAYEAGIEVLSLDARGNNHAALGLYASLGFVTTGRRPDAIAVGDDRFDQVLMHLDLRPRRGPQQPPPHRHGGRREGIGST